MHDETKLNFFPIVQESSTIKATLWNPLQVVK